ncbi:hypothetical protein F5Y08DRAFT_261956 [Xylaria arbuscula]|nr:hypothetical protein F5Y08DRAFT_261956 [Xylaria arbuscula]
MTIPNTGEEHSDRPNYEPGKEDATVSLATTSSLISDQTAVAEPKDSVSNERDLVPLVSAPALQITSGIRNEDSNGAPEKLQPAIAASDTSAQPVTVRHWNRNEFILPWALCQTQKGMEGLLKSTYKNNEAAQKEIEEGKYEISTLSGAEILPSLWEALARPGLTISVRLKSQGFGYGDHDSSSDDGDESKDNIEDFETSYTAKIKYTVATFAEDYNQLIFLYNQSYDEPVALDKKERELPILEEVQRVTVPRSRLYWGRSGDRKAPKSKPRLEPGDTLGEKSLHIHSPFLLNALKSIIKYSSKAPSGKNSNMNPNFENPDERHNDNNDGDGVFPHPYEDLFYYKQELSEYKTQTTGSRANHTSEYNAECDRHIDFLLEYLDREPNVRITALEAMWAKKVPTTTFSGIWLLMKPGSDVYVKEEGQLNAYVVESVSGGVNYLSGSQWSDSVQGYTVCVWYLRYDGKVIARGSKFIDIPVFDNEREILSLPIFPAKFYDNVDGGERRKRLIERGRKAFNLAKGPTYLEYTGMGLKPGWKQYNQTRVVVEHESRPWESEEFAEMGRSMFEIDNKMPPIGGPARAPCCKCSKCRDIDTAAHKYISATFSDYDNIYPKDVDGLSEHQYMIFLSHMFGFILKDRAYDIIDVGRLRDVKIVENAIDRLVMRPEKNKDTIKAIVKTYTDNSQNGNFHADFIRGKGEGQIFLLHGPPGTGKTLTAESVAEYTRRPLLSITAADLGHVPIDLEKNLLQFLKNASNWDAVVLLDEADVYLEERSAHDLRRNSIVSVFLRAMEYFQGILFLTTNRVGHFDEAFMSRIHVSIGYEPLDDDARVTIWDNLFRKLKEDHKNGGPEILYEYDAKQFVKKDPAVQKLKWNGREIRNAFQTAVALAVFDSRVARDRGASEEDSIPEIKEKHLAQVVNMSTAFKKYITATHEGIEDADRAYKLGIRHDRLGHADDAD